jgi:hypothetical protein
MDEAYEGSIVELYKRLKKLRQFMCVQRLEVLGEVDEDSVE